MKLNLVSTAVAIGVLLCLAAAVQPRSQEAADSQASNAVGSMRSINTAQAYLTKAHADRGFACDLAELGPGHANLLDGSLTSGKAKNGYRFRVSCPGKSQPQKPYFSEAVPVTGKGKAFCSDETAVIKYSDDGNAQDCHANGKPIK